MAVAVVLHAAPLPAETSEERLAAADPTTTQPEAILYYFHRTQRCEACLTIEAYIDGALRTHFVDALSDGRLLWLPTNIDEAENIHFEDAFDLEFNSAVLVRFQGTETISWVNLEEVWDLLDDEDAFVAYVRSQVATALAHDPADVQG
jgi:hypothetical protein